MRHANPPPDLPRKAHYACGGNILPGWLNLDGFDACYPWDSIAEKVKAQIMRIDLAGAHPFPANQFEFGYSEHFLEHLDQAESLIFLAECHRTLAPGGVLRLAFPGLRGVLRRHYRQSDFAGANQGRQEAFTMWSHKHFYCEESLALVATHLGFSRAEVVPTGHSAHPELCDREIRNKPEQAAFNLVMELTK